MSGYSQTRRVLSAAPVAIKLPKGFQPMDRMLRASLSSTYVLGGLLKTLWEKQKGSSSWSSCLGGDILVVGDTPGSAGLRIGLRSEGVEVDLEAVLGQALPRPQQSHAGWLIGRGHCELTGLQGLCELSRSFVGSAGSLVWVRLMLTYFFVKEDVLCCEWTGPGRDGTSRPHPVSWKSAKQ